MTVLILGLIGVFAVVAGVLLRVAVALVMLALLVAPVVAGVFGWHWLTVAWDRVVQIRRVGHLRWRRDSCYTPGHLWLRPMRHHTVRVGVDDIAQRVLPDVRSIALPAEGTRVLRGEPIADLSCGRGHVVLRSPVSGTITDANPRLAHTPGWLHRDPYGRGWVVDIETPEAGFDGFVPKGRASTWLATEEQRLTGFFERALGMAAADGGELMVTPPEALTDDQWRAIQAAFLDSAA